MNSVMLPFLLSAFPGSLVFNNYPQGELSPAPQSNLWLLRLNRQPPR